MISNIPRRIELRRRHRVPLDPLHPRRVYSILPHNRILLLHPPIHDFHAPIRKARQERLPLHTLQRQRRTRRLCMCLNIPRRHLHIRIPRPHDPRVSAREERPALLMPVQDHASAALKSDRLAEDAEGAHELCRALAG